MLCAMSFSAVAHVDIDPNDEYGYGQHDAQSFKFSVESCNEKVPVLLDGDVELCHYFLDESAVRAHFRRIG